MDSPTIVRLSESLLLAAPSSTGFVAVAVRGGCVTGVSFGHESANRAIDGLKTTLGNLSDPMAAPAANENDDKLARDVLDRLVRYLDGEPVDFDDVPVTLKHLSAFQRRVVAACRAIGFGRTRSYGELAAAAGSPGAARAVGQVMAGNRTPLIVPCHRVLAANGKLGGFSAPQGLAMKRRLLELEAGAESQPRSAIRRPKAARAHAQFAVVS